MLSEVGCLQVQQNIELNDIMGMTSNTIIAPPASFRFKNPEEWPKWLWRFERYRISTELNKKDEVQQINTMIYCIGDEADDILRPSLLQRDRRRNTTR